MSEGIVLKRIARIHSDYKSKFGIPRQSGIIEAITATIVFEPEFRNPDSLRGIEEFSHLWLLWEFSESLRDDWTPMVRPPKLGGNKRVGVFATRSPFRPNPIGLSSVRLLHYEPSTPKGPILTVCGADLLDNTPIYDIKPYLPYTDLHTDASGGFALTPDSSPLTVEFSCGVLDNVPGTDCEIISQILSQDPRPGYQSDPDRIYTFEYGDWRISFKGSKDIITVTEIIKLY